MSGKVKKTLRFTLIIVGGIVVFLGLYGFFVALDGNEIDDALIGEWLWTDSPQIALHRFNPDNSGTRGFVNPNEFVWRTVRDNTGLVIETGMFSSESWDYTVTEDILTKTRTDIRQEPFEFIRISTPPGFIGTWVWDENSDWLYVFNDDSTGIRGIHPNIESFDWITAGHQLLMNIGSGERVELYNFVMDGGSLIISSRTETWSYTKAD